MRPAGLSIFWRAFTATAAALVLATVLLIVTPVKISPRIALIEVLVLVAGLGLILVVDFLLLRRAFRPLERLAQRMETVDLLHPGQRLPDPRSGTIGRLVRAFNDMLERWPPRRPNARGSLAASTTRSGRCSPVCCSSSTRSARRCPRNATTISWEPRDRCAR